TIVPEIEMPAHVQSALAAYPQFSCRQEPLPVPPGGVWPITNIYCAGNDSTFIFLQDVLTEVLDLFPSPYIHIGGDEAHKKEWKACTKCQRRIEEENLEDEDELQSYFIQRIEKFLNEHDRILIGWDEILEGGLADNATVMSWRGIRGGIHAARMDHDVVMTPTNHCYFDYFQSFDKDIEPYAIGGYTDLKKVYAYEPVPDELSEDEAEHILGTQGNVWTEYMLTGSHVEYMALPRMTALSEVQWSKPTRKNEDHFMQRLRYFLNLLSHKDINYHLPAPQGLIPGMVFIDSTTVKLENPYPFGQIRYTTNGEKPAPGNSTVYTGPITISSDIHIQAAIFLENGHRSIIRSAEIVHELPLKALTISESDLEPGLSYEYHEGAIATLDDFGDLDFRHSGVVNSIRFP
ncbi:MAG: beta-N-acetylhexosaminidase, partial [Calditrichaeota bacterium]